MAMFVFTFLAPLIQREEGCRRRTGATVAVPAPRAAKGAKATATTKLLASRGDDCDV